jgi:pimeloyl-ACP methyl ester carboxylesterase
VPYPLPSRPGSGSIVGMSQVNVSAHGIDTVVHTWGPVDGVPVLLIHGNVSSGLYWEPLARLLPANWRVAAPDLRGYGLTTAGPVDARLGLAEFVDDVVAVIDAVFAGRAPVVVGHSMGGGIAMRLAVNHPGRVRGLLLEAPLSPYGFGGTGDLVGTASTVDFAGTGGGGVSPDFVKRLAAGDRSADDPASPRNVMKGTYVADPTAFGSDEDAMLDTLLSTVVSADNYPGDSAVSPNWPGFAPGTKGVLNAMSPRYFNLADALVGLAGKPPIRWVRGDQDLIVSDASLFDLANLGKLGAVPGWPGADVAPPQPMVSQTRAVLHRYAQAGGTFTEVTYESCGHSPHIERPAEFAAQLNGLVTSRQD